MSHIKPRQNDEGVGAASYNDVQEGIKISSRKMLLQRFSDLHDYLCLLGEHVNQVKENLDHIDKKINDIRKEHALTNEANKAALEQIKAIMVTKSEAEGLLHELSDTIRGELPILLEMTKGQLEKEELSPICSR